MTILTFWTIRKGDLDLARKVKESCDRIVARGPRDYKIGFKDGGFYDRDVDDFVPKGEKGIYFIAGTDLDNILGYAGCTIRESSDFGGLLHVGIMEVFRRRMGVGSGLLDYCKFHGFGRIELEANCDDAVEFFETNGFFREPAKDGQVPMYWKVKTLLV